jgi:hypothetical protein
MNYELRKIQISEKESMLCIFRTDDDGTVWFIPEDEANSDYQKYLVDTDGGLPTPKEGK